jgi:dUTP pyrophosphatase
MTATMAQFLRLTPTAQAPKRGSDLAAGLDVCADFFSKDETIRSLFDGRINHSLSYENDSNLPYYMLKPGHRILIPTGIAMGTDPDIYTRVAPRSGLALKQGLEILGGVVDCDYTGEIGVICRNGDPEHSIQITHGMRIAQLVLTRVSLEDPIEVSSLETHLRGADGFGSTGT